jgi:signal transduction histidine kinase
MKLSDPDYFSVGPRLAIAFTVLIVLILLGNGLIIWEFNLARIQTDRLNGANQQLTAVLQLQVRLLAFHQKLDDSARSSDMRGLTTESETLRRALGEQVQQTRAALAKLPPETKVDPAFLAMLETIEATLPAQLDAIDELAKLGDWATVQRRLGNELNPIETETSVLVGVIDEQARGELARAQAEMRVVQNSILIIVPATAISTFCIAAFLGWSIARRIVELRLDERVNERMRITHELHDTLLQTIQASKMIASSALEETGSVTQHRRSLETLSVWLDRAVQEGRTVLNSIYASATETNDLAQAFQRAIEDCRGQTVAAITFSVTGLAMQMHPIVRDEIYRIGHEALRNACLHAHARRVDVDLRYSQDLTLSVRDNGVGIDPAVLDRGKEGHFGLEGMRDRAARIGAKLHLTSSPASGTVIKLVVPGGIIFRR